MHQSACTLFTKEVLKYNPCILVILFILLTNMLLWGPSLAATFWGTSWKVESIVGPGGTTVILPSVVTDVFNNGHL